MSDFTPYPVSIEDMMRARDERVQVQNEMLAAAAAFPAPTALLSFGMNIPGAVKQTPLIRSGFLFDGTKKQPIMIHRAGFGSFERFIGILTENYEGKFPVWLSPCQVKVLPVSEKSRPYAHEVAEKLAAAGIRVKVDDRDEKIGYKIREARSLDRVPYMLILGEQEVEAGNISVRDRSNETHTAELDEFIAQVVKENAERVG